MEQRPDHPAGRKLFHQPGVTPGKNPDLALPGLEDYHGAPVASGSRLWEIKDGKVENLLEIGVGIASAVAVAAHFELSGKGHPVGNDRIFTSEQMLRVRGQPVVTFIECTIPSPNALAHRTGDTLADICGSCAIILAISEEVLVVSHQVFGATGSTSP